MLFSSFTRENDHVRSCESLRIMFLTSAECSLPEVKNLLSPEYILPLLLMEFGDK